LLLNQYNMTMTTIALNNLWNFIKGLTLSQKDREWLASKLIMGDTKDESVSDDELKERFLSMAGYWEGNPDDEAYFEMMSNRNYGRNPNRNISDYND